jgi:23S rRNA pseudouridine2457 synthase
MHRYFIVHKPRLMLSQFVSPFPHRLLGDLNYPFPEGTHAIGRLDHASEGLILLSTDKSMTRRLLHPGRNHRRTYLVQVERKVAEGTLEKMMNGIEIPVKRRGNYLTMPCSVEYASLPASLHWDDPMFNKWIEYTWLKFVLTEGKNRQIRKMCKLMRHSCTRLIRTSICDLELGDLPPGGVREIEQEELFRLLNFGEIKTGTEEPVTL